MCLRLARQRLAPGFRRPLPKLMLSFVNMCKIALDGLPGSHLAQIELCGHYFCRSKRSVGCARSASRSTLGALRFKLREDLRISPQMHVKSRFRALERWVLRQSGSRSHDLPARSRCAVLLLLVFCCLLALSALSWLRLAAVTALHAVMQPDSQRRSMQSAEHAAGNATPPRRKCALCAYGSAAVTVDTK